MTALVYRILILPVSLLPMPILYRISDVLYFLVLHVVRYRTKVVAENIRKSFPLKSEAEREAIARDFYRHFCDLIVESFKGFTLSKSEINGRFKVRNPEILNEAFAASRSVILTGGHYNNWEWFAIALRQQIRHRAVAIYKPLSNQYLDKKMRATRGKYGLEMIPMKEVGEFFETELTLVKEKRALPFLMVFGIDQSPGDPRKAHWGKFLNQDTGIPFGAEKFARKYDLPVYFGVIQKVARGHYAFEIRLVSEPPHREPAGWILEAASAMLETEIKRDPRFWLWTHRRWKHAKPV